ncbi:5'/3'-nucleotidase SurE [bacterium]|nr:5'/3'-nucleotidase SurE [bacterium]
MSQTHILVTNDDGIDAFGIGALEAALEGLPGVRMTTVAPATQQSATSRSMTLHHPLRLRQLSERRWSVSGTPTDSVMVALGKVLADDRPDFVLSGINHGPNMGEDVHYSGTVAAAMEACVQGIPSAAVSLADWRPNDFGGAAAVIRRLLPDLLEHRLPDRTMWNINVPDGAEGDIKGIQVTHLGTRTYHDVITEMKDPRGRPMMWIAGQGPDWQDTEGSDYNAVRDGYASLTPLKIDVTDHEAQQAHASLSRSGLPGDEAFAEDGDRFVLRRDGNSGLTLHFEGPTRGPEQGGI